MKRLLAFLFALSLAGIGAASAATPPALNHLTSAFSSATATLTVSSITIGANHLLVVGCGVRLPAVGTTLTSISDTAGDTFTYYEYPASGSLQNRQCFAFTKTAGMSGGSIVFTYSASDANTVISASVEDVTGFNTSAPEDTAATKTGLSGCGNVSTSASCTSGTPSQANDLFYSSTRTANVTLTEDATWTSTANGVGNTNSRMATAYIANTTSGTKTRTTALSGSSDWRTGILAIAPAPSSGAVCLSRTLLGVGC